DDSSNLLRFAINQLSDLLRCGLIALIEFVAEAINEVFVSKGGDIKSGVQIILAQHCHRSISGRKLVKSLQRLYALNGAVYVLLIYAAENLFPVLFDKSAERDSTQFEVQRRS